jgi:glutamate racemase
MDNRPIGIYDSGVGGLSIFQEIRQLLPSEGIIYFGDSGHCPYGTKSSAVVRKLSVRSVKFLINQNVKLVVVACNTVTVTAIDYLRETFSLPLVGMVPVVKTAAETTKNGKIGILCTPLTAKSQYQKDLIGKFAKGLDVYVKSAPEWVNLVESGKIEGVKIRESLRENLDFLVKKGVDTIALGCSHYPYLRKEIEGIIGPDISLLDSGGAVARRVRTVLVNNDQLAEENHCPVFKYFTTGDPKQFKKVTEKLVGDKAEVSYVDLK